jgi:hypothetical protein
LKMSWQSSLALFFLGFWVLSDWGKGGQERLQYQLCRS